MDEERLSGLGDAVLRNAKRLYLQSHPLVDGDRLGQYAYWLHQTNPSPACCLYCLDGKSRLLETEVLYSGITLCVGEICACLADRMKKPGAVRTAVSMARAAVGMDKDDLDRASRIALFCETEHIPLLDIVWVDEEGYLPLCRYFGRETYKK